MEDYTVSDLEQEVDRAVEQAEMRGRRGVGSFFLGMLVGALVGGSVALLFAPKPGSETRVMLKERAGQTKEKLQEGVSKVQEGVSKVKERVGRMRQNMPSTRESNPDVRTPG